MDCRTARRKRNRHERPSSRGLGWCVIVKTKPVRVCLAVANVDGSTTRWRVFVFAERSPLQWLIRSGDPRREIEALREHVAAIVSSIPNVREISWDALV